MAQLIRSQIDPLRELVVLSFPARQGWAAREVLGRSARTVMEEAKEGGAVTAMVVELPGGSLARLQRSKVFTTVAKADPVDVATALNLY